MTMSRISRLTWAAHSPTSCWRSAWEPVPDRGSCVKRHDTINDLEEIDGYLDALAGRLQ